MRLSQMLWVTLREDPAEAELPSHKLLLRAGYIRRIGSGLYAYLPLMWRVLQKISAIVREEMDATGAQECLLTQLQPAELWQESGRWDTYTKAEGIMFALTDRANREVGLGPTHEEVITAIARDAIRSYRQLPQHLYQIQTKFRDEIRPRFGLMRGREFIMKDGYSFHVNEESLKETYYAMDRAYRKMFDRCGLKFRAVEADSGAIGGSGSQEFMVLAEAGEDDILFTEDGRYAANVEKAVSIPPEAVTSHFDKYEKLHTPKTNTIESVCKMLKCSPTQVVKQVLYQVTYDNGVAVLVLVSIRGDRDVNEVKLQNELTKLASEFGAKTTIKLEVPDLQMQSKWAKHALPLGFISPNLENDNIQDSDLLSSEDLKQILRDFPNQADYFQSLANGIAYQSDKQSYSLNKLINYFKGIANAEGFISSLQVVKRSRLEVHPQFLRFADRTVEHLQNFVTGADEADYHVVGANWGKEFPLPTVVNLDKAQAGDRAVHDPSQILQTARGIEVGHIFQLGTKYSQAMKATFTNEQGEELPLVMGCYGLGVSRLAQAAVEQCHDKDGIIWNKAIAPYHVIVTVPNIADTKQIEVAESLYHALQVAKIEVLLDDRDERAGVKFKDADLVGIPYRVVTGKAIADGKVEIVNRVTKAATLVAIANVVEYLQQELS
jgi:prolyl-tRNA synthetase